MSKWNGLLLTCGLVVGCAEHRFGDLEGADPAEALSAALCNRIEACGWPAASCTGPTNAPECSVNVVRSIDDCEANFRSAIADAIPDLSQHDRDHLGYCRDSLDASTCPTDEDFARTGRRAHTRYADPNAELEPDTIGVFIPQECESLWSALAARGALPLEEP